MKIVLNYLFLSSSISWVCKFLESTICKDKHCNSCDPKRVRARLVPPQEEKYQTYEKDNNTNKKNCIYLEAFRMSTKQLQLFSFAITEWYSVNRTTIISYKLHQRQLKMKKTTIPIYN